MTTMRGRNARGPQTSMSEEVWPELGAELVSAMLPFAQNMLSNVAAPYVGGQVGLTRAVCVPLVRSAPRCRGHAGVCSGGISWGPHTPHGGESCVQSLD